MEILLIRHAQPAWVEPSGAARNDPGLTDLGRAQALALAGALGTTELDALVCSTAVRSQATAVPLADVLGLEIESVPELFEIRLPPEWDGAPAAEVGAWFRDARRRGRHEWWQGAPGGEDFATFHHRVTTAVERLLAAHGIRRHDDDGNLWDLDLERERRIGIVAHAGTNSVILSHLLGLEPEPWEWERFSSAHASITEIRATSIAGSAIWSLRRFSDASHCPKVTG